MDIPGYQVAGLIGKGSMGEVYRARHVATGADVAIKTLQSQDPALHRALANEWQVLLRIEHPFLVNERELVEHEGRTYLVMEYVEGVTMTRWLENVDAPTRKECAGPLLDKVCQVLLYLHTQEPPVIVRDLKPDNIMLRPDGTVKLIDFGIARELSESSKTEMALKGYATVAYAPLEQYSARSTTTVASDVYALGATAFHVLSGKAPPSAVELVSQQLAPRDLLLDAGVPLAWAALIDRAMQTKAADRIGLQEFHQGLPGKPGGGGRLARIWSALRRAGQAWLKKRRTGS